MMAGKVEERNDYREWLSKKADKEDACQSVAAGGLLVDLGVFREIAPGSPPVFGRLIEFARRSKGWNVEEMAKLAEVSVGELISIEQEHDFEPQVRTVYKLGALLGWNPTKLMQLAGLSAERHAPLGEAAIRFAARSEPTTPLTPIEQAALDEFARELVESTDKR
ncbi:MAG: helix-turn-helix transcriptional regulator [Pirellulales bacterium]|nr:helix-turn-helix transcriptional regulator [Pirellulales bacterium]